MINAEEEGGEIAIAYNQKSKELEKKKNEGRKRKVLESESNIQRTPPIDSSAPCNMEFELWNENVLIRQLPAIKEKL